MNKTIKVYIYSYKGKMLYDVVSNLIEKSSKNNKLFITIDDQNPLYRKSNFDKFENIEYNHIFWDHIKSPCIYKQEGIYKNDCEYTLMISDHIFLNENWDELLINNLGTRSIISGQGRTHFDFKNLFYTQKRYSHTDFFDISNYIDRDLLFAETALLKGYYYPTYLKYNGEEEALSLLFYCEGFDILSCPSNFYEKRYQNTLETLYVPFSINHNYNMVIDLFKTGTNKFVKRMFNLELDRSLETFIKYHNFAFDSLEYLPFNSNDVEYDNTDIEFDNIDQRKFMTRTHSIG